MRESCFFLFFLSCSRYKWDNLKNWKCHVTCKGLPLSCLSLSARNFFGGCHFVTGFLAEMASLSVIKGRAMKNELSWFCCYTLYKQSLSLDLNVDHHGRFLFIVHGDIPASIPKIQPTPNIHFQPRNICQHYVESIPTFSTRQLGFIFLFDFLVTLVRGEILRASLSEWYVEMRMGLERFVFIIYSWFIHSFFGWYRKKPFRSSILNRLYDCTICLLPIEKVCFSITYEDKNVNRTCSYFLTASYDGQIRAFDYYKMLVSSSLLHSAPITSLCII